MTAGSGEQPPTVTSTASDRAPPSNIGGRIGRYVMVREVGSGGMGTVWEAYDPALDRLIALKLVLDPAAATDPSSSAPSSLDREARALARVTDPRVVAVHDVGREGAMVYIAMELVRGHTLKSWLAAAPRSIEAVVDVLITAGRGLEAVHRAGLVHRDVKPSNVLLGDDGRVCVSDLGIAVAAGPSSGTSSSAGTPAYMAPEQRARRGADARSDQYGFCVTAWEALSGALPDEPPGRPIPATLRAALERGRRDDPEARWPSLGALLGVLERWRGRRRRRLVIGGSVAIALAAAATFAATRDQPRPDVCAATAGETEATWNPTRRQALAGAFAAVSPQARVAWQRTEGAIEAWVQRWRGARIEACDDTRTRHVQPTEVLVRRELCLSRRLDELDGLLAALAQPDAQAAPLAVSAAWSLRAPETCLSPAPADAPLVQLDSAAKRALVRRIAGAGAIRRLGRPGAAVPLAAAAAVEAELVGDRGLLALALTELGTAHAVASQHDAAVEALRRAIVVSDRAGLDELRFSAWGMLALVVGEIRADRVEGTRILEQLAALHDRLPPDLSREASLHERTAAFRWTHGDFAGCLPEATRAVALWRQALPGNELASSEALNMVGLCHERLSHYTEARAIFQELLDTRRRTLGEDHARTAMVQSNLASVANSLGDYVTAEREHRRALEIRIDTLGPDHRDVAQSHNNFANTLIKAGKPDEALIHATAARDIWSASVGPRTPMTATATAVMGHAERALGHLAEAEAHYRTALAIRREVRDPDHADITRVLGDLAVVAAARGRLAEAIALADEAFTRSARRDRDPVELASAEFDRLVIHAHDPRRRAAAVERVATLCPLLTGPDWTVERAACDAFVARGGIPAPP